MVVILLEALAALHAGVLVLRVARNAKDGVLALAERFFAAFDAIFSLRAAAAIPAQFRGNCRVESVFAAFDAVLVLLAGTADCAELCGVAGAERYGREGAGRQNCRENERACQCFAFKHVNVLLVGLKSQSFIDLSAAGVEFLARLCLAGALD